MSAVSDVRSEVVETKRRFHALAEAKRELETALDVKQGRMNALAHQLDGKCDRVGKTNDAMKEFLLKNNRQIGTQG